MLGWSLHATGPYGSQLSESCEPSLSFLLSPGSKLLGPFEAVVTVTYPSSFSPRRPNTRTPHRHPGQPLLVSYMCDTTAKAIKCVQSLFDKSMVGSSFQSAEIYHQCLETNCFEWIIFLSSEQSLCTQTNIQNSSSLGIFHVFPALHFIKQTKLDGSIHRNTPVADLFIAMENRGGEDLI